MACSKLVYWQFGGVSPFPIPNEQNGTLDINKITQVRYEILPST